MYPGMSMYKQCWLNCIFHNQSSHLFKARFSERRDLASLKCVRLHWSTYARWHKMQFSIASLHVTINGKGPITLLLFSLSCRSLSINSSCLLNYHSYLLIWISSFREWSLHMHAYMYRVYIHTYKWAHMHMPSHALYGPVTNKRRLQNNMTW